MFRRAVESSSKRVTVTVDGRAIEAREGDTVAGGGRGGRGP
jgi:hypothetical protein